VADPENPDRFGVTAAQIELALARSQRCFPAIVVSYDEETMRAEVQPALRIRGAKTGSQTTPTVVTIPVAWPSWGDFVIQGVLEPGDEVLVECVDRNWLAWLQAGGVVDYNAIGGRQAGYAVARPLALSNGKAPGKLGQGEAVKIGKRDGSATVVIMADGQVRVQASDVRLGSSVGAPLAVGRDTDPVTMLAVITTFFTQVAAVLNAPGPVIGAPATITPIVTTTIGTIAATSTEVTST